MIHSIRQPGILHKKTGPVTCCGIAVREHKGPLSITWSPGKATCEKCQKEGDPVFEERKRAALISRHQ